MFLKNGFTHGLNYPKVAGRRTFLANTHLVQKVVIEMSYVDIPRLRGPPGRFTLGSIFYLSSSSSLFEPDHKIHRI